MFEVKHDSYSTAKLNYFGGTGKGPSVSANASGSQNMNAFSTFQVQFKGGLGGQLFYSSYTLFGKTDLEVFSPAELSSIEFYVRSSESSSEL